MATMEAFRECSICGEDRHTCKHPWHKPFEDWPKAMLQTIFERTGESSEPRKGS